MINEPYLDNVLLALGHDDYNRGTAMLREAVKVYDDGARMMTKEVYPAVAKRYGTTPSRVERNIRHSIDKAWNRGDEVTRMQFFGYSVNPETGKPTAGEYTARLARICREGLRP